MCAINGFTWRDEPLIRKMNAATAHRGPDGTGVFCAPRISLGHNRLAIIDLSPAGAQPMKSADGRFVISFNGEIYNFKEIKKELAGYPFQNATDTETIVAAFAKFGKGAFARLQGMFAFALWDTKEQTLFLVRDPVGIKPLYYWQNGSRLIFSSEIKAILEHNTVPRRVDLFSLNAYLRVNYVPAPHTMFAGIKKLLPGHVLTYRAGAVTVNSYRMKYYCRMPVRQGDKELARELRDTVRTAVKKQLVSDRPVGLFLSGGVDSSVVLEGMSRARGKVESFSVGFKLRPGEQEEKFNADFLLARSTARFFGATHHEVLLSPEEILPVFEEAVYHLDEPISNATIIPQLILSRFAKKRVAVVLGGDGGDELFGGYERYRYSLLSSYYRKLPELLREGMNIVCPRFRKFDTEPGIERFAQFHFLKEKELGSLVARELDQEKDVREFFASRFFSENADHRRYGADSMPFEARFMLADRESWLLDESLARTDKMTMASGLEARVPLLDLALIEFTDRVPRAEKVSLFRTKVLLKKAYRGFIPEALLHQPKRGWFSPGAKWLRYRHVADAAREILSPSYASATAELFNWDGVRALLDAHLSGGYHLTALWAIITLQVWARRFEIGR